MSEYSSTCIDLRHDNVLYSRMSARPDATAMRCAVPDQLDLLGPVDGFRRSADRAGGTRAQAPQELLAERHGRRGSRATWLPALSLPAAVPALQPMQGKPCS